MLISIFIIGINIIDKFKLEIEEGDDYNGEEIEALCEYKDVELSIVAFADTVVNPRAMMVIPVDTCAAQVAMTAPWCANHFAVRAKATSFQLVEQFCEIEIWVTLERARI